MIPDTIGTPTPAGTLQKTLRWVQDQEREWMLVGNRHDPVTLPWMPFQPAEFLAIMFDVVAETNGPWFLDVGCGIGTKMKLAEEIYRLNVVGIEKDPVMAEQAASHWPETSKVLCADALHFDGWYKDADIIWLYRPFRDAEHEVRLEKLITENMKSGAILAGGKWEMSEPPAGWITIVDDWDTRCGAWQKP